MKLDIFSYITELFLLGRLETPFQLDVTGLSGDTNCGGVFLSGSVDLPTQGLAVQAELALDPCDNCSSICSAQDVLLMVHLDLPWNVTLEGTYMLTDDNVTEVTAATQILLSDLPINISAVLQSEAGKLSIQEVTLDASLQNPFNLNVHGVYSQNTSQVILSGILDSSAATLFLELAVDIESEELSAVQISGNFSLPFMMNISGSYSLQVSNSSKIALTGSLDVPGLSNLTGMIEIDLLTSEVLGFSFEGVLAQPLGVMVSGDYNIRDGLVLRGDVDVSDNGSISAHGYSSGDNFILSGMLDINSLHFMVDITFNATDVLSIQEINLNVSLESPLSIDLLGSYSESSGGALLSGVLGVSEITLTLELAVDIESQTVNSLMFSGSITSPFMMSVSGSYNLLESNSDLVMLAGSFDVDGLSNFTGMIEIDLLTKTIQSFSFEGVLAQPLAVMVSGEYNCMDGLVLRGDADIPDNGSISTRAIYSSDEALVISGELDIDSFHFTVDVTFNTTDTLSVQEVNLNTSLESPFNLDLLGGYSESGGQALLSASLDLSTVELALELAVDIESQTVDSLTFSGNITSPFMMSVSGSYNLQESNSSQILIVGSRSFQSHGHARNRLGN